MTKRQRIQVEKMLENNLDLDVGMAISLMGIDKKKRYNVLKLLSVVCKYYFNRQKCNSTRSVLVEAK